jgi:hypothetical protein
VQSHYSPDGRWWWNGQQWVPVPPTPSAPGYLYGAPAPKTNGLAIASLVLSLLWLGGLGSILAVIFGISSRNSIKKSQGRETGDGLALAGLIIGIVGVLGAVLFYGVVVAATHTLNTLTTPQVVVLGHPLDVSGSDATGIRTVTVYSVSYPVNDASGQPDATAGEEYAAADVQVCATTSGSQNGPSPLFNLLFQD